MAGKRSNPDSLPTTLADSRDVIEQPAEGGSYSRCPDTGELTLLARTSHESTANDQTTNADSQESQA